MSHCSPPALVDTPASAREPAPAPEAGGARSQVVLVGSPNVGKSVVFGALTGRYVVVSNYPGTTVEVARGRAEIDGLRLTVVDTPGLYGLRPLTDEERVSREVLLESEDAVVVQVVEARALARALPLTLQLRALGRPMVLVLNMMDEARSSGMTIDVEGLEARLGIPVVPAVAIRGQGMEALRSRIVEAARAPAPAARPLPEAVAEVCAPFQADVTGARGLPPEVEAMLRAAGDPEILGARAQGAEGDTRSAVALASALHRAAQEIAGAVVEGEGPGHGAADRLHDLLVTPWTGVPILLLVLYVGLYLFVGVFGAGTVVDFLENRVFGAYVNPWVNDLLHTLVPGDGGVAYWTRELFGGRYGVVTLGVTYAFAIILPIVFLFFLFFSALEDSGYFPRLAMLVDRVFKRIGLNGRAVIPVVLGFACDTMATMVTRVQETRRERIITTLLLALAIPCSAQYGVIVALLAAQGSGVFGVSWAFLVWAGVIFVSFLATGLLASRVVPGETASFYMELPPLRWPRPLNVLAKVVARMKWYFFEVLPVFVIASVLIWAGRLTGIFDLLTGWMQPLVRFLGLPGATAEVFLYGFFRRDFGAAGLYDMAGDGTLSTGQILVATVTLTLFLPCVAQLLIMYKERGPKATAIMVGVVFAVAFLVGGALHLVLDTLGWMA